MDLAVFQSFVKHAKQTHAQQRFAERSILPSARLKRMEGLVAKANKAGISHLPSEFTVPFKDRSTAAMSKVKTRKGERLVMKTVLGPGMKGRGPSLKLSADEFSTGKDDKGWYVHTHRARSKSYPSKEAIPKSVKKQIGATG